MESLRESHDETHFCSTHRKFLAEFVGRKPAMTATSVECCGSFNSFVHFLASSASIMLCRTAKCSDIRKIRRVVGGKSISLPSL